MTLKIVHRPPPVSDTERPVPRWAMRLAHALPLLLLPACLWRLPFALHFTMRQEAREGSPPAYRLSIPYVLGLSVLTEVVAILTIGLVRGWGETAPAWIPFTGGRRVRPMAAVVPAVLGGLILTLLFTAVLPRATPPARLRYRGLLAGGATIAPSPSTASSTPSGTPTTPGRRRRRRASPPSPFGGSSPSPSRSPTTGVEPASPSPGERARLLEPSVPRCRWSVTRLRHQQIRPERNARPVPGRRRTPRLGTVSIRVTNQADVIPLRPLPAVPALPREPLWRDLVGEVLRRERQAQGRTLKDVAEAARISMPYLSEVERGLKEASSEVLAAAAQALGLRLADVLALAGERLVSLTAARSRSRSLGPSAADGRRSVRSTGPAGSVGAMRLSGPMGGVLLAA